jgi:ABC transporter substrate binding protein
LLSSLVSPPIVDPFIQPPQRKADEDEAEKDDEQREESSPPPGFSVTKILTATFIAGPYERLPALAAELIARQGAVIVSSGGTVTARAALSATTTTSIVFNSGSDPMADGVVASLNRPGGNVTGVFWFAAVLGAK